MKVILVALVLAASTALYAQQSTYDWRLLGDAEGSPETHVFYDAAGTRKLPDGHYEVWLKALPIKATDNATNQVAHDKARIDHAAQKLLAGYVPPLGVDVKLTKDQIEHAVLIEEVANEGSVEPTARILEEVDCEKGLVRQLNITARLKGQLVVQNTPKEWQHIAPETNTSRLRLALCR
jgi:hypothetical protein